ncbi:MAG: hypothetical protein L6R41_006778 [Letrouitia leprolyta]|nr:MAG: hypothetical protein L6R41_006778 [Letrouitia leprolyta]
MNVFASQPAEGTWSPTVMTCERPSIGSQPLVAHPLSTKTTTASSGCVQYPTESMMRVVRTPQLQLSSQKIFHHYKADAETKTKKRQNRTCMSCYNRGDRQCLPDKGSCDYCAARGIYCRGDIETLNLFDQKSFDQAIETSVNLDLSSTTAIRDFEQSLYLLSISWDASPILSGTSIHQNVSSCILDLQSLASNNLSSNLSQFDDMLDGDIDSVQDYDDSKRNSEKDHTKIIQASCRRLRTLLYILSHPETNFIKYANYDMVVVKGSVCMGFPVPELAAGIVRLSSHLEFVGKGVDEKTFLMEIKKISTMQPALCISTFVSDYPDAMRHSTFYDILSTTGSYDSLLQTVKPAHYFTEPQSNQLQEFGNVSANVEGLYSTTLAYPEPIYTPLSPHNEANSWMTPVATEGLDSFAIQEQEYRERTEADFLHLSGQHRTSKQNDCDLEGKTYTSQTLPGVTNEQRGNFFDKMVSTDWASGEKDTGPSQAKSGLRLHDSRAAAKSPSLSYLHSSHGKDEAKGADVEKDDSGALTLNQEYHQDRDGGRKRKQLSSPIASKKPRMLNEVQRHIDAQTAYTTTDHLNKPGLHQRDIATRDTPSDDDSMPPTTLRPISWPYLAGVSVRMLTEAFEKTYLQQEKP